PVSEMTMEECAELARRLGRRVGDALSIPVYLYEFAASAPHRRNLAAIREGEYEGLAQKIVHMDWKPDFGPAKFNPRCGATVIGARKFLVAYNVNLNTMDKRLATRVAFDVRERGLRVTGSEIVGLVPLSVLLAAGRHYLRRMGRPAGVPEPALVRMAIQTLGLSEVKPFDPKERVIEYRLQSMSKLASLSVRD